MKNNNLINKIKKDISSFKDNNLYFLNYIKDFYDLKLSNFPLDTCNEEHEDNLKDSFKTNSFMICENKACQKEDIVFNDYCPNIANNYEVLRESKDIEYQEPDIIKLDSLCKEDILEFIREKVLEVKNGNEFIRILRYHFEKSGLTQKKLSEKANVDFSYLNKVLNDNLSSKAIVSRDFLIKLCFGMNLNINECNDILMKAGYYLVGQDKRDTAICYCLQNKVGLTFTNIILHDCGLKILS